MADLSSYINIAANVIIAGNISSNSESNISFNSIDNIDINSNGNSWVFDTTGNLTVPGIIIGAGNSKLDMGFTDGPNTAYLGTTESDDTALYLTATEAQLYANTYVNITAGKGGTSQIWTFDANGSATFPANGTTALHHITSNGLAEFGQVHIGGDLNYSDDSNLILVEDKNGFADIIAQNKNSGGNASMNILLVNDNPGNSYMSVGINSSNFTPFYNTLFEIPNAGYVSHTTNQIMGPQSSDAANSRIFLTYSSGSYALELNEHGAIGWGASYDGNLTQGNFGNVGQVLTSAGENSAPTWNNITSIANGTSNIDIATANGNVIIAVNGNTTMTVTGTGANVTGTLSATGDISTTGNIAGKDFNLTGNGVFGGNLTVNGNLTYIETTTLAISDPIINLQTVANGGGPSSNTGKDVGAALNYYDTSAKIAWMGWDTSNAEIAFGSNVGISSEVVTFDSLANIRSGNANLGNLVTANYFAGVLTTAVQPNITSVGTLASLSVAGTITGGNLTTGGTVSATGTITGGSLSVGTITLTNGAVIKDTAGDAVAFGQGAGLNTQGDAAVAVGYNAGQNTQQDFAVAIGSGAGTTTQSTAAVAVGSGAGSITQGIAAVAVGSGAGQTNQGQYGVAIGSQAGATNQGNNSIILNATGGKLNQTTANTFTVKPVRQANTANAMYYNAGTGEITYDTAGTNYGNSNVATFLASYGSNTITTTGVITGNGSGLSSITGANVTGEVANATFATTAGTALSVTGANVTGEVANATFATTAGTALSVTGTNVSGEVANATFATTAGSATTASTVTTAVQPNITGVGTLSSLSVAGNVTGANFVGTGAGSPTITSTAYLDLNPAIAVRVVGGGELTATGTITSGNLSTGGTVSATGTITTPQFISTIATGTAPFVVTSTTRVANLNVATAGTATFATSAGSVTGTSQGNITSVGALTSLFVVGTATVGNLGTGGFITANTVNAVTGITTGGTVSANGTITGGNLSTTGNISGNTNGFTIGYLNIPQVAASNATLGLTDAGKHYYSTSAGNFTLTIPTNATVAFATGTAISIVVQSLGNVLVNAASGVTLYMAGNSTAANRTVGGYAMATLMKVGTDTWMINGTGVV